MRTNIDIDDALLKRAMAATGETTKKATVEAALRIAIRLKDQTEAVNRLAGLGWEGNLDESREGRQP